MDVNSIVETFYQGQFDTIQKFINYCIIFTYLLNYQLILSMYKIKLKFRNKSSFSVPYANHCGEEIQSTVMSFSEQVKQHQGNPRFAPMGFKISLGIHFHVMSFSIRSGQIQFIAYRSGQIQTILKLLKCRAILGLLCLIFSSLDISFWFSFACNQGNKHISL